MDMFRAVEFDIRGLEPKNRILGEDITIVDKTCPWVIPDASPFFTEPELWTLYDERGAILTLNKDYWLEEEFIPFCDMSGRSIRCFVRLSDEVRENNKKVKADYQSIGAWFVPRNNLQEWLNLITTGKPIPWEKVFGVPETLPPEFHSHSVLSEIGDWYELSFFFNYMANIYRTRDVAIYDDVDKVINDSFNKLTEVKNAQLARIVAHDSNYNVPHGTNKGHLLLGNLDNFDTATPAQDLAGTAANLFSTPRGAQDATKARAPDTSAAMYAGVIPISQFGNNTFIPPNITGSFEGMGQETECSGICLEPNGTLMLLSNHYDGRTSGLYFSTVENYLSMDRVVTYTNYKYQPPVLEAQGIVVDRIISGSGNKVIMVGVKGTNDWFVALTNNTFDPASHAFVRCDMTDLLAWGNPWSTGDTFGNDGRAIIHHMGKWLVLVQSGYPNAPARQRFYRCLVEDVRLNKPVKWEALPVTYTDWHGRQFVTALDFIPSNPVRDANNKIIALGPFVTSREINEITPERRALSLSWPITGSNGLFQFHVIQYYNLHNTTGPTRTYSGAVSYYQYTFNPETGVFSLVYKQPEIQVSLEQPGGGMPGMGNYAHLTNMLVAFQAPSAVLLANGTIASAHAVEGEVVFPVRFQSLEFTGVTSAEQLLSKPISADFTAVKARNISRPIIQTPTKNGTEAGNIAYEHDGEFFTAYDQLDYGRKSYFRVFSGGYENRPAVKNLKLGDLLSRPLTTQIFETDTNVGNTHVSITGTAQALANGGVEAGNMSFSSCSYSSTEARYLPTEVQFRAPNPAGAPVTFPRTHSRTIDLPNKKALLKAETFYALSKTVTDKIQALVPASVRKSGWGFNWVTLGQETGMMFKDLNLGLLNVVWDNLDTLYGRCRLLLVRPVIEAPNAAHPDTYLITDYQVLDDSGERRAHYTQLMPTGQFLFQGYWRLKANFSAYRDGNKLSVMWVGAVGINPYYWYATMPSSYFDINLTTNKLEDIYTCGLSTGVGNHSVFIPKVGATDKNVSGTGPEDSVITGPTQPIYDTSGGAAAIYKKTGVGNFMVGSAYPETGWIIFFQENIKMMISGTMYTMEGGIVDLRDIDPDPTNKTFYVYATVEGGIPKYVISVKKLRKRANLLPAATLVTNDRQILTITRLQPFMVGDYMLSNVREGGTIPVSAGFPQDPGNFLFLKRPELLP